MACGTLLSPLLTPYGFTITPLVEMRVQRKSSRRSSASNAFASKPARKSSIRNSRYRDPVPAPPKDDGPLAKTPEQQAAEAARAAERQAIDAKLAEVEKAAKEQDAKLAELEEKAKDAPFAVKRTTTPVIQKKRSSSSRRFTKFIRVCWLTN